MLGWLKSLLLVSIIGLLSYSAQVFSETDFKCYVQLSNSQARIENQFALSASAAKERIKKRFAKRAGNNNIIIAIPECIQVQANFSTYKAHKLDMITPQ
jgi:hypothetical protein